jgi:GH15 family glucan-1,4-alpha-glucosidase
MGDQRGTRASPYPPIADYAVVGDCRTAALIGRDGSIDWYCPDRFDGPAVLCRLLDADRGGYLRVAPPGGAPADRRYRPDTNVLDTVLASADGRVRLTDFMPIRQRRADPRGDDVATRGRLLRLIEGLAGEVELEVAFKPTFDYGRRAAATRALNNGGAVATTGARFLALRCAGLRLAPDEGGVLRGRLRLGPGERAWLELSHGERVDGRDAPELASDPDDALVETVAYWRRWAARCTYRGPYRTEVVRSALALKLLTYEPTGAIVAAPTTSLPEEIGGERNWDYRYAWLRDASLILYALLTVGYRAEAADFSRWLERAVGDDPTPHPQIMYGIDGARELDERLLGHLDGYCGSRPVRVGNAAHGQRQIDIFGEVLNAAHLHDRRGGAGTPAEGAPRRPPEAGWALLRGLVERAAASWPEAGRGLWEVRSAPQHFVYGKLMCWVALDRGIRLARDHGLDAPLDRWERSRAAVRAAILEHGYDRARGAFVQAFGSSALDASALVIPRVGFLPPTDRRVRSTVERIRRELTRNGLVDRYRTADGLAGGEGSFVLCTFWLVDALALGGRLDEAHDLFDHTIAYANDLGLLSEEVDPVTRELLGNFPQGFSHLALIGAAVNLAKAAKHGAEGEAENEADRAERAGNAAAEGASARREGPRVEHRPA